MTRTHFHGPGGAEQLDGLCLVCLMVARGAELDALADQWEKLERDGQDHMQKWFEWDGSRTLIRDACVDGISDVLPQSGLLPLCWDHLGGLVIPKRTSLANGGRIPPGLLRGRG